MPSVPEAQGEGDGGQHGLVHWVSTMVCWTAVDWASANGAKLRNLMGVGSSVRSSPGAFPSVEHAHEEAVHCGGNLQAWDVQEGQSKS